MPIIPITDRTPEERREIARKGGLAKAANAKRRRQLHACRYDDIAELRREVASLARLVDKLVFIQIYGGGYDGKRLSEASKHSIRLLEEIEKHEQKDTSRLMYGEAEAGELPPLV